MLRAEGAKTPPPLFSLSMETIVNNEDLLTEILVLLPLKSLLKLKCVSKHWLALITSHAFSTRRRSYLNSAGDLVFQANRTLEFHLLLNLDSNNYDSAPANVFEKNKPFMKTKMIESCNGLFLCCDDSNPPERLRRYYGNYNHTYSSRFCVWNPTSKRYALLPPLLSLPCSLRGILRLEVVFKCLEGGDCIFFANMKQLHLHNLMPTSCFKAALDDGFLSTVLIFLTL
ncbi:PREDICTED: F-box protein At5g07610-like [Populus euphratica]|uniref:F-box protein At5g07610-like n=1 Tax=Populus euphratica TaxID=75702 RepID=A0AAJ6XRK4_POPEU|nr:PREDICTED: F-box protein At5g07610-like [Populus euphratica]